jgi:acid phosphatase type 7
MMTASVLIMSCTSISQADIKLVDQNTTATSLAPGQDGETTTLIALADAADCRGPDAEVAALVDEIDGEILMVGDTAYPNGSAADFENCFAPLYADDLERLGAVPGDNDYNTGTANAFFTQLGSAAGAPDEGWLSFETNGWLIIGLNSNCQQIGGCDEGSAQYQWLDARLADHAGPCVLAFMHEPRFTSSMNYNGIPRLGPLYELLLTHGTDVLLVGHSHHYERFERLDGNGQPDPAGIANFTIGIGGAPFSGFGEPLPGSIVRASDTRGVLQLKIDNAGYQWEVIPTAAGGSLVDAGSDTC